MASTFHADVALARELQDGKTLPANWYCDSAVFEAETDRILHGSWQYVGHIGQAQRPGDFFTTRLGNIPVVVTCGIDGTLRAFANVCRHRGSEVVLECAGNRKTLQCHYHGWTYNLDGSLRAAPRAAEQASFAKEDFPLLPFAIETWGPMVFVYPAPRAQPLSAVIGELPAIVSRAGVDLTRIRHRRQDVYELAANWKIIIENFNECYHCPIAHPKFSEVIDTDTYSVETSHEYFSTYFGPLRKVRGKGVTFATLWPTAMFSLSPNPHSMQLLCVKPLDAGHSRLTIDYYFADEVTEDQMSEYVAFSDLVQREDIVLCESVQRGMSSGVLKHGHLMLSREGGIQHFQNLVFRALNSSPTIQGR